MGKSFWKTIKNNWRSRRKTNKSNSNQGQVKIIKKCSYDAKDTPFISRQKEIFNELVDERREKIVDLVEKVNSDDLIYRYKGNTPDLNFNESDNALDIIEKIRDGKIDLADVKNNQEKFKSCLGEIKKRKKIKSAKKYFV